MQFVRTSGALAELVRPNAPIFHKANFATDPLTLQRPKLEVVFHPRVGSHRGVPYPC